MNSRGPVLAGSLLLAGGAGPHAPDLAVEPHADDRVRRRGRPFDAAHDRAAIPVAREPEGLALVDVVRLHGAQVAQPGHAERVPFVLFQEVDVDGVPLVTIAAAPVGRLPRPAARAVD